MSTEPATIRGRVIEKASGRPLSNVPVFATQLRSYEDDERRIAVGDFTHHEIPCAYAVSDDEGLFSIDNVDSGAWMVLALGHGWVSVGLGEIEADTPNAMLHEILNEDVGPLELAVEETACANVTVLDEDGAPINGVDIRWGYAFWMRGLRALPVFDQYECVKTDELGVAQLRNVIPNRTTEISVHGDNPAYPTAGPLELASGSVQSLEIVRKPIRTVDIEVTDKDSGQPIVDAEVSLLIDPGAADESKLRMLIRVDTGVRTDDQGKAQTSVVRGAKFAVDVQAQNYGTPTSHQIDWVQDEPGSIQVCRPRTHSIEGRLIAPDGLPFRDVRTTVYADTGSFASFRNDGLFQFEDLLAGTYRVEAELAHEDTMFVASGTFEAGSVNNDLVLSKVARDESASPTYVVVQVVGPDVEPVASCAARLTGVRSDVRNTEELRFGARDGFVHFKNPGGELWLDVFDIDGGRLGSTQVGPFDPNAVTVVRVAPAVSVQGFVRDAEGQAVPGVAVFAHSSRPRSSRQYEAHAETLTNQEGHFELTGLSGMDYRLTCNPPEGFLSPASMRVAGGSSDVTIELRRAH